MGTTNGSHHANGKAESPLRIAVVGGGIGGLALALGLTNRQREGANLTFQIFEAAPQFKEIGAGVGVGPNAYRALRLLGLGEEYKKLAFTHDPEDSGIYFIWRWGENQKIKENGGSDVIGHTPCFEKGGHTTVHRAEFLDMMIERLPEGVANFNKRLVSYEISSVESEEAPVRLHFADGTTHEADVLVAADGIKSVVRPTLLAPQVNEKDLKPKFTRTVAYRALIPMEEMVAKIGEKARKGTMYLGKDHHILTFPIQSGKTMNVVAFASDRSNPEREVEWGSEAWILPGSREEMMQGWEDWSPDCQKILESIKEPNKWALHELADLPTHAVGPVCLMGDAAAATLPHQGQGAAQAIESAFTLSSLLAAPHLTRSSVQEVLQVYNDIRYSRTTGVKTTSNELGRILEFADGKIDGDKDGLVENLQTRYAWMWGWDGETEVARGYKLLEQRLGKA